MFEAHGWVIVRSSRDALRALPESSDKAWSDAVDRADDLIDEADDRLFDRLEEFLADHQPPGLDWHFRRHMNNVRGILLLSSSHNHRGLDPPMLRVLRWIATRGPDSYGLVHFHDAESEDHRNEFRVWRIRLGQVDEMNDPHLSPIGPDLDPEWLPNSA